MIIAAVKDIHPLTSGMVRPTADCEALGFQRRRMAYTRQNQPNCTQLFCSAMRAVATRMASRAPHRKINVVSAAATHTPLPIWVISVGQRRTLRVCTSEMLQKRTSRCTPKRKFKCYSCLLCVIREGQIGSLSSSRLLGPKHEARACSETIVVMEAGGRCRPATFSASRSKSARSSQ